MRLLRTTTVTLLALTAAVGCRSGPQAPTSRELPSPAPSASRVPNLTEADDRVLLSWVEEGAGEQGESKRLRFATGDGEGWSEPSTIVDDARLFVNWADFPVLSAADGELLSAAWPVLPERGRLGYGIRFSSSSDSGTTWSDPTRPHEDDSAAEHGFVSIVPAPGGAFDVVWLDGRAMESPGGTMRLMANRWNGQRFEGETVLDADVCTCCQTDAARVGDDLLVAYRDRTAEEIRDVSLVRRRDGAWQKPRPLHADGWHIAACPVNGPALEARAPRVAVAWFTSAEATPRVLVVESNDGGRSFGEALRVDGGEPLGRVALRLLPDGGLAVAWLEKVDAGAEVRVRRVDPQEGPGAEVVVGLTEAARTSGFPRVALLGERLIVGWTVRRGAVTEVRVSEVTF
jgi:hypothetical protein